MVSIKIHKKSKASIEEKLIILSISLMPFTALKIGPVGPAEIIILLAFLKELKKNHFRFTLFKTPLTKYFLIFICVAFIGMFFNLFNAALGGELSAGASSILFDLFSYLFIFMTLTMFEMHEERDDKGVDAEDILYYVVIINCFSMTILFILSKFTNSIFGLSLRYYQFFAPFANNVHHTSMYLLPLSFATTYFAERQSKRIKKLLFWVFSVFFMYLAISTGSAKAVLGIISGGFISILYKITTRHGFFNSKVLTAILLIVFFGLFVIILKYREVFELAVDYFVANDIAGGRQTIWGLAFEKWKSSPLVGFGFGSHVKMGDFYWDAHNTLISALLQAGAIGFSIFVILWISLLKACIYNGYLLALNISILVYVTGGDVLRRIPCWSFMIISYYIIRKTKIVSVSNA